MDKYIKAIRKAQIDSPDTEDELEDILEFLFSVNETIKLIPDVFKRYSFWSEEGNHFVNVFELENIGTLIAQINGPHAKNFANLISAIYKLNDNK